MPRVRLAHLGPTPCSDSSASWSQGSSPPCSRAAVSAMSRIVFAFGSWNVHFSGEYYHLGETTHSFNVDKDGETSPSKFVGMIGIGVSY